MELSKDTRFGWSCMVTHMQQYSQDYDELFSPVIKFESVKTVIAFAMQNRSKLHVHQMDADTVFLMGNLKRRYS